MATRLLTAAWRAADSTVTSPPAPKNDLEHGSGIARQMVGRWHVAGHRAGFVLPSSGQESATDTDGVAPATRELADAETRRIIEEY